MKTLKKSESKKNLKNNGNSIQKIANNLLSKKSDKLVIPSFKDISDKKNNKKLFSSVRKYKT
jgi:hypothetical protein